LKDAAIVLVFWPDDEEEDELRVDDKDEVDEDKVGVVVLDVTDPELPTAPEETEEEVWFDDGIVMAVLEMDAEEVAALWVPTSKKAEARTAMTSTIASTAPTAAALLMSTRSRRWPDRRMCPGRYG
jgi:hypothetical protein